LSELDKINGTVFIVVLMMIPCQFWKKVCWVAGKQLPKCNCSKHQVVHQSHFIWKKNVHFPVLVCEYENYFADIAISRSYEYHFLIKEFFV
jgi:hypothetical protein